MKYNEETANQKSNEEYLKKVYEEATAQTATEE